MDETNSTKPDLKQEAFQARETWVKLCMAEYQELFTVMPGQLSILEAGMRYGMGQMLMNAGQTLILVPIDANEQAASMIETGQEFIADLVKESRQ